MFLLNALVFIPFLVRGLLSYLNVSFLYILLSAYDLNRKLLVSNPNNYQSPESATKHSD